MTSNCLAKGASHLEGTLPEPEIANHWLVKFPRGRMTLEDQDVLRAEGVRFLRDLLTDDKVTRLESDGGFNAKPGGYELLAAFLNGFHAVERGRSNAPHR